MFLGVSCRATLLSSQAKLCHPKPSSVIQSLEAVASKASYCILAKDLLRLGHDEILRCALDDSEVQGNIATLYDRTTKWLGMTMPSRCHKDVIQSLEAVASKASYCILAKDLLWLDTMRSFAALWMTAKYLWMTAKYRAT